MLRSVRASCLQQIHHVGTVAFDCPPQRRMAVWIFGIDIRALVQERLHKFGLALAAHIRAVSPLPSTELTLAPFSTSSFPTSLVFSL